MKCHRSRAAVALAVAACLLTVGTPSAVGQEYPSKPVRVFLEFAAGASGDVYMRAITTAMSKVMGQPVVIENRPGAGGVVAAEAGARAVPDGYTLLASTSSSLILRPHLIKNNSVDLARDLTPITGLWSAPSVLVVSPSLPVKSVKELIEYARANPGNVAYGTTGIGGTHHFNGEQLQAYTGVKLRHIPYKPNSQNYVDVVSGELPMVIGNPGIAAPFIKTQKVRLLAVIEGRSPLFPDSPGLGELVPGFSAVPNPVMLFGPAKLPSTLVRRINGDVNKALALPEVRQVLHDADLIGETPEAFQARINQQIAVVAKIAKAANIQPTE